MVRRGSTVRVRQRALKSPEIGLFCCLDRYDRAPPFQGGDRCLDEQPRDLRSGLNKRVGAPCPRRGGVGRGWGQVLGARTSNWSSETTSLLLKSCGRTLEAPRVKERSKGRRTRH